jgi:hypothetical protein
MAGETIISMTYGLEVLSKDDPYLTTIERAMEALAPASIPGNFLVNFIPALKYVPDWMPFTEFKHIAKEARKLAIAALEHPFQATKREMVRDLD